MRRALTPSRLSLLSLAFVSALGVAACGSDRGPTPADPVPAPEAQAVAEPVDEAAPSDEADRGPGFSLLKKVEALDLRAEQRVEVERIRDDLRADLAPQRASAKKLAGIVADGLEAGKLDSAAIDAQRAELEASAPAVKAAVEDAANALHAVLDPAQRAELVLTMRAHKESKGLNRDDDSEGDPRAEHHRGRRGPLAKLAKELGLTEDQRLAIRDAFKRGAEELFPQRKQRRAEMRAQMELMGDAFMSDDFDAARFDFAGKAPEMMKGMSAGATMLVGVAVRVLTPAQRTAAAQRIRERAAKI